MDINEQLEHLRGELRAERISWGELAELQSYGEEGVIDPDDYELLEAAGVPEHDATALYEKCGECHLFVDENTAYVPDSNIAPLTHLHRGTEEDEALDDHEPTHSGDLRTLYSWKRSGPPEMRERFVR